MPDDDKKPGPLQNCCMGMLLCGALCCDWLPCCGKPGGETKGSEGKASPSTVMAHAELPLIACVEIER